MTYNVAMPQLGLTMNEGAVVSWQKQTGDWVNKGEVLFTVETDKAVMEVEAVDAGYLNAIKVEVGQKVPVGTVIALLSDQPGVSVSEDQTGTPQIASPAPSRELTTVELKGSAEEISDSLGGGTPTSWPETKPSRKVVASPRARRLAQEMGIDITAVRPARGQRIVEEDIRRFQASTGQPSARTEAAETPATQSRASATRRVVAQRMAESFHTAPHFYLGVEVNATDMVRLHDQLLAPSSHRASRRLTYTDLFLRAMATALKEHPEVNAYWQNDGIRPRDSVDTGFAVQTPDGLLVPVIRNADQLNLFDLARERHSLTERAKEGKISLQQMEGGSATLTNLGASGIDWFQAILNPPQSVILAMGRISQKAVVINNVIEICPTLALTLSVDHRVLDGVAAAQFLGRVKELAENPVRMLM